MAREKSVLIVEGWADKAFFEHVCRSFSVETSIRVSIPTEWGGEHNTRGAIFNNLPLLMEQMRDGRLTHVAAVIDSDLPEHGGGQLSTLNRFANLVAGYGFEQRQRVGEKGGYIFKHNDGLHPIGLWIMPDNERDGAIEHFIASSIRHDQRERFEKSVELLNMSVKPFLFEPFRRIKAEVLGWLAWQKMPGQGIYVCVRDNLVDQDSDLFEKLRAWLSTVF